MRWSLDKPPAFAGFREGDETYSVVVVGRRFGRRESVRLTSIPLDRWPPPDEIDTMLRMLDTLLPGPGRAHAVPGPCRRRRHAIRQLDARIRGYHELIAGLTPKQALSYKKPGSLSGRK